jgi:hypothetical protein
MDCSDQERHPRAPKEQPPEHPPSAHPPPPPCWKTPYILSCICITSYSTVHCDSVREPASICTACREGGYRRSFQNCFCSPAEYVRVGDPRRTEQSRSGKIRWGTIFIKSYGLHDTVIAEAVGIITHGATLVELGVMIRLTLALMVMLAANNPKV